MSEKPKATPAGGENSPHKKRRVEAAFTAIAQIALNVADRLPHPERLRRDVAHVRSYLASASPQPRQPWFAMAGAGGRGRPLAYAVAALVAAVSYAIGEGPLALAAALGLMALAELALIGTAGTRVAAAGARLAEPLILSGEPAVRPICGFPLPGWRLLALLSANPSAAGGKVWWEVRLVREDASGFIVTKGSSVGPLEAWEAALAEAAKAGR